MTEDYRGGAPTASWFYSVPFVLGTPVIRGSASTAIRRARAADLKMASATWWLLRP